MLWVKGELLTDVDALGLDPTGQLERAAQPFLFDRREWFRRVGRHLDASPLIGRAASEGALCWLFLQRESRGTVASLSNRWSFAFRPVFAGNPDAERQRAMLVAISKRLKKARPRIASLCLWPVPENGGTTILLQSALRAAGWITFAREFTMSWIARMSGRSFAEYLEARPSLLQDRVKSAFEKSEFETQIFRQFKEEVWSTLEALLAGNAGNDGITGSFEKEFAVVEGNAATLRLGLCLANGAVVAAQLWTVENGSALIHRAVKLDGDVAETGATLLTAALFRQAIDDDRVEVIEWTDGLGDEMAEWMDERAPLNRIYAFNPSNLAGLLGATKARLYALVTR